MPVDEAHVLDDLFGGTADDDESSIGAPTTDESDESGGDLLGASASVDSDKAKKAEKEQIDAWVSRVESGKMTEEQMVKELTDKQKGWLANKAVAELSNRGTKVDPEAILKKAVEVAEERFEMRRKESEASAQEDAFMARAEEIRQACTPEQRATILAQYRELVGDGKGIPAVQRTKMLELIAKTAGVSTQKSTEQYRAGLSSVKTGYGAANEGKIDWATVDVNKLTPAQRAQAAL